jgi:hypothetical protein
MGWSADEVKATVASYLQMLKMELAGQSYNKTRHRRALLDKLDGRTEAAIELKHRNISAVLIELDHPAIPGYKPLPHYQKALIAEIIEQLSSAKALDTLALDAVQRPATPLAAESHYDGIEVPPPDFAKTPLPDALEMARKAVKRDYLDREARNASLGAAGEEFVVNYERWRLISGGQPNFADRVEHVSRTKGDGLGYDIESLELDGRPRLIEVKTTSFGRHTPFFISRNELTMAKAEPELFVLTRVFEFRKHPRLFNLRGPVEDHCNLDPISYRARFF